MVVAGRGDEIDRSSLFARLNARDVPPLGPAGVGDVGGSGRGMPGERPTAGVDVMGRNIEFAKLKLNALPVEGA